MTLMTLLILRYSQLEGREELFEPHSSGSFCRWQLAAPLGIVLWTHDRLAQRPAHLFRKRFRGLPFGEPIASRRAAMRKMRSFEDEIEQRDQPAVVLVQRFTIRGMVPTMKGGA